MAQYQLSKLSTKAPKAAKKEALKLETEKIVAELNELQNLLYAQRKHSILVILQGMDASGKDGIIRKVFGKMNPQGVDVASFKVPTEEELGHDFLWRIHKHVPAKGEIQIFNRSHYEDILVTRVNGLITDAQARKRMKAINDFEQLLQEQNNTVILKFYLHVSEEEQKARLQERMEDPTKMWKYNKSDSVVASQRKEYFKVYEDCFKNCNKPEWHIVPVDQNWYKEYYIAKTLRDTLKSLKMKFPTWEEVQQ